VDAEAANRMMKALLDSLPSRAGKDGIKTADDFAYLDPVDHSSTSGQGVRLIFENGSRIIYRLSGTGTAGATLRVYIEQFEPDPAKHHADPQVALKSMISFANNVVGIQQHTGRSAPTVIT
jgi:phosphoglucomutase